MKDLSVLQESPFTDKGSVVEVFTDMSVWLGIRKVIEQVNANAAAARNRQSSMTKDGGVDAAGEYWVKLWMA